MSERFFASDNAAPVHPAVMEAITAANTGHAVSYGADRWTRDAIAGLRKMLGAKSEIAFVYNGTGANVLGMQAALASYHAVICTDVAHIDVDECGSAEHLTGAKLITVPAPDGRMNADQVVSQLYALGVEHHSQPKVVSLTQSTELGTVYDPDVVREIARVCHSNNMFVHVDGARISNAAVSQDSDIVDITGELGVDILSFGGTKNGMMFGEAVVFFRPELASAFRFIRKQGMQLASKMRFIAAQFSALYVSGLWRELAGNANAMARSLSRKLEGVNGIDVVYPVEANAVFARMPADVISRAQERHPFYTWDDTQNIVRLMCSYDTTSEDIENLVITFRELLD